MKQRTGKPFDGSVFMPRLHCRDVDTMCHHQTTCQYVLLAC